MAQEPGALVPKGRSISASGSGLRHSRPLHLRSAALNRLDRAPSRRWGGLYPLNRLKRSSCLETPRNDVLPAIWAPRSLVKVTQSTVAVSRVHTFLSQAFKDMAAAGPGLQALGRGLKGFSRSFRLTGGRVVSCVTLSSPRATAEAWDGEGARASFAVRQTWAQILALSLTSSVTSRSRLARGSPTTQSARRRW